jgi:hypothetical protein
VVVLAVCTTGFANPATAAPPGRAAVHWDAKASAAWHAPLDLHLPAPRAEAQQTSANFPSALHHLPWAAETPVQQTRIPGQMEELARRVHREGLPVARLWENKSALVSLGLNQRGKPGLWLIQKTH